MRISSRENDNNKISQIKLPFRWCSHPAAEKKIKGVFALMTIILAGIVSAIFMQSIWWGFFAVFVLFLGLARFFLPTEYTIDDAGIWEYFAGTKKVSSWRYFRRAIVYDNDVFLSPFPKTHIMDRFRGWYIRTPDNEVAKYIANKVKNAER